MRIDVATVLSDNTAVTATAVSTHVYDTGSVGDIGIGEPPYLVTYVGTSFAGSSTLTISLETDDNVGFSSATTIYTSQAFAVAGMTAATQLVNIPLPMGCERYLRVRYTVSSTAFSAGTVTTWLAAEQAQANRSYPSGINVTV